MLIGFPLQNGSVITGGEDSVVALWPTVTEAQPLSIDVQMDDAPHVRTEPRRKRGLEEEERQDVRHVVAKRLHRLTSVT